MVAIIDSPDFMFLGIDISNLSRSKRIYLFLKGLIVGFIFKKTKNNTFCFLMNILFPYGKKIYYKNGIYFKDVLMEKKISYPNKRIVRVIKNESYLFQLLYESYCLDEIKFKEEDLVIDCGANVGELLFSFHQEDIKVKYFGYEPEPTAFNCLSKNIEQFDNATCYNFALSDVETEKDFYVDLEGGNSSLEFFGKNTKVNVGTKKIDSFKFHNVKLLKIEAEGHEETVLKGSLETLKRTEYVVVDYGPEKGILQKQTISEVVNLLYENDFQLISSSKYRQIGLFKNNLINNE